jgi:hypothetical protein
MNRLLSGAVAVVLIGLPSGTRPEENRRPGATPDLGSTEKRLDELEVRLLANQAAIHQLVRMRGKSLVLPPGFQPWSAPTPDSPVTPSFEIDVVPDPGHAAIRAARFDRCLITVDGAAFDAHFRVKMPEVHSRMVIAPRVKGLPAGSWPYGRARR